MLGQQPTSTFNWQLAVGWSALAALMAGTWWASTIKDPPSRRKSIVGNARRSRRGRIDR